MEAYFEWLKSLPPSVWIAQSDSIWAYPSILFLHSVGMGLSAGSAFVICLRLLGVASPMPLSSFRIMFRIFWTGFYLNLVSGSLLFAAAATTTGYLPIYYIKLLLIAIGMILSVPLRRFVDGGGAVAAIPPNIKGLAAVSFAIWVGVITTGRLIAYIQ